MNRSPPFDAVAIGASAGGVAALLGLIPALPAEWPAAVLVAQHLDPSDPGVLPGLLARRAQLPVEPAADGVAVRPGVVYVAQPGLDLLVTADRRLSLVRPRRVHAIPSVDLMFGSAAAAYGDRLLAVVLTGCGSDGARGAAAVKRRGGRVLAQDPGTAVAPWMPRAAIAGGAVDLVLPLAEIAPALTAMLHVSTDEDGWPHPMTRPRAGATVGS